MENEVYYTVEEVAEKLRVTPYTLRGYIRDGELEAIKVGKKYRISETHIQDFLQKQSTKNENRGN